MAKPISIILLVSVLATVVVSASAAGCTGAGGVKECTNLVNGVDFT